MNPLGARYDCPTTNSPRTVAYDVEHDVGDDLELAMALACGDDC